MADLVFRRCRLLGSPALKDVSVVAGRIAAVAEHVDGGAATELDLEGRLLLPAFANPHMHLSTAFTWDRWPNESGTFAEAARLIPAQKKTFTHDDVRGRARRLVELALRHGTTSMRTTVILDGSLGLGELLPILELREAYRDIADIQVGPLPFVPLVDNRDGQELVRAALKRGCDLVGVRPHSEPRPQAHVDIVFGLAKEFDLDIDAHIDYAIADGTRGRDLDIVYLARKTMAEHYEGRVSAGHVCGLSAVAPAERKEVATLIRDAGISVVACAAQNLYMHGRSDPVNARRGIVPVAELLEAGVNVAFGSDNVRDPYSPFGRADMLQEAYVLALGAHIANDASFEALLRMATEGGARAMRLAGRETVAAGARADLVVLDARSPTEAVVDQAEKLYVFQRGRMIQQNSVTTVPRHRPA